MVLKYGGFISYSHGGDAAFAQRLQRDVERFAKPWNKPRAVRIFRDDTHLSASPDLWSSIESALEQSDWLILLSSPEAAASKWVDKEIGWWLDRHGSTEHVLMVLTAGELVWDDQQGRFDRDRSTAVPAALAGSLDAEPLWIDARWSRELSHVDVSDPRMQRAVVDVASAVRGIDKDELVGEAVEEQRRTRRLVRGAWSALTVLVVFALLAAGFAWNQRGEALDQKAAATKQARVAQSRQLAAAARQLAPSDLGLAARLAMAAADIDDNEQTRTAMVEMALASPHLEQVVDLPSPVTEFADSRSADSVVVGLADGSIVRWSGGEGVERLGRLDAGVSSVAASSDGATAIATDGATVLLIRDDEVDRVEVPSSTVQRVGMSPSGAHAWVVTGEYGEETLYALDPGSLALTPPDLPLGFNLANAILLSPDENTLVVFEEAYGYWARVDSRTWEILNLGAAGFGLHEPFAGHSPDGAFLGVANMDSGQALQLWPSTAPDREGAEIVNSSSAVSRPVDYAIGTQGLRVAAADSRSIVVSPTAAGSEQGYRDIVLNGGGSPEEVRFIGDDDHLVSGADSRLFLWDLGQLDRLATTFPVSVKGGCNACSPPDLRFSPGGDRVAVVDDEGESGVIVSLDGTQTTGLPDPELAFTYDVPVWLDNQRVAVPVAPYLDDDALSHLPEMPDGVVPLIYDGHPGARVIDAVLAHDHYVTSVLSDGSLVRQDADSLQIASDVTLPEHLTAVFDPEGRRLGLVTDRGIELREPSTGELIKKLPGEFSDVAFAGPLVLAVTSTEQVEVWDPSKGAPAQTLDAGAGHIWSPAGDPQGELVARVALDGSIDLDEIATGQRIGSIPAASDMATDKTVVVFNPVTGALTSLVASYPASMLSVRDLSQGIESSLCAITLHQVEPEIWAQHASGVVQPPDPCS